MRQSCALAAVFTLAMQAQAVLPLDPPSPQNHTALHKLARNLRSQVESAVARKDLPTAARLVAAELEHHPDAALYAWLGGLLFLDQQYLNAGIALKRSDVLAPLPDRDRFTLAMSYVILKMPAKARVELLRLTATNPRNVHYRYWLARVNYDEQKFEEAMQGFESVLAESPGHVRARDNLGLTYEALGRNSEAIAAYRTAMISNRDLTPCSPWPGHNLGALLRKLGDIDQAEAPLRESLTCDPNFAKSNYQLALVLEKSNSRDNSAITHLEKAIQADAAFAEPHYALGRLLQKQGKSEQAAREFATFQELRKKAAPSATRNTR